MLVLLKGFVVTVAVTAVDCVGFMTELFMFVAVISVLLFTR